MLNKAQGEVIAILNHNSPAAYFVPAAVYQQLIEKIEDYELGQLIKERQNEKPFAIEVSLDDL